MVNTYSQNSLLAIAALLLTPIAESHADETLRPLMEHKTDSTKRPNNFYSQDRNQFRNLVCLWGFSPLKSANWYQNRLMAFPIGSIISETKLLELTPSQFRLIYFHNFDDKSGEKETMSFSILRGNELVPPTTTLDAGDVLLFRTPDIRDDGGWVPAYSLFYNRISQDNAL